MPYIRMAIEELHKGFEGLNQKLFDGELPTPAILIQNQGRKKNILGWCTVGEIWRDKTGRESRYEITITAEYLHRPYTDIFETMLHEMVHLYCRVKDIKDTSRGFTYHNKRFKAEAEAKGLIVEHGEKVGWAYTSLKPETKELIEGLGLNAEAFKLARQAEGGGSKPKKKGNSIKYVCPSCEIPVRATKPAYLKCMDCNMEMVREDGEEDDMGGDEA